jgi:cytochrome P450
MIYSPLHPNTLEDPFSVYQELRKHYPILWHKELHAWVLSRYEDCKFVLSNYEKFPRNPTELLGMKPADLDDITIQSHDPPHSAALRRAIFSAFQRIDIEAICKQSMDRLNYEINSRCEEDSFNFMSRISEPVALNFTCNLIGVSMELVKDYNSICVRITEAMDSALDPKKLKPGLEATAELNEIISNSLFKAPNGSIIYELLNDSNVQQMNKSYVRNTISAMFNAAYSSTHSSMGSLLNLALNELDLINKIKICNSIDTAVQELIRMISPAQATMRFAAQDIYIGEVLIKKTDPVIVLMASANHDSAKFERPSEFNPNRYSNNHLGFGWGVHFCVGAMPARIFLKHYVKQLGFCVDKLQLVGIPQWQNTVTLRCLKTLLLKKRNNERLT